MATEYLKKISFLVVDDNDFMRTIVRRILASLGAETIHEATDGADALKLLKVVVPDIVILDWRMTPLDGIEFTQFIRRGEDSPNPFLPIIMMTGYSAFQHVMDARDAGVNEFLVKPVSAQRLFSRIQAVIERPRSFVRTQTYFGPDRRRRNLPFKGPDRRTDAVGSDFFNGDDETASAQHQPPPG